MLSLGAGIKKRKAESESNIPPLIKSEPVDDVDVKGMPGSPNKRLRGSSYNIDHSLDQTSRTSAIKGEHSVGVIPRLRNSVPSSYKLEAGTSPNRSAMTTSNPFLPAALQTNRRVDSVVHSTSNGEWYIELSPRRRACVRRFKGQTLIDIREFYGFSSEKKPCKKGIALTVDQWKCLRKNVDVIDAMVEKLA